MSDKPGLQPGLAVGDGLRAVARDILAEARAAIEDRSSTDAEAVHDFRRAMKRWRALLRLLDPFLGKDGRQLRREARDLARALGSARDAQSALDALEDLAAHGSALSARSLATVRARIAGLRQTAEANLLTGRTRTRLLAALAHAEASVAEWPVSDLAFTDVANALARSYRAARRERPGEWSKASADDLHELRKRVVNHRYQIEIIAPLWPRFGRMWVGEIQRLRERLGKHHDLVLLSGLLRPQRALAPWRTRLAGPIAERMQAHVTAARKLASRLFVDKPDAFRRRLEVIWETEDGGPTTQDR
jgi:CHAD domain-containing protein